MSDNLRPAPETTAAKYARRRSRTIRKERKSFRMPSLLIPVSFFLVEGFSYYFLRPDGPVSPDTLWPLLFGLLWTVLLTALVRLLPGIAGQITYALAYFIPMVYAVVQTGYYLLFQQMLWLSDFRFPSENADFFHVLISFPPTWWAGLAGLLILGILMVWKYPRTMGNWVASGIAAGIVAAAVCGCLLLPKAVFLWDNDYDDAQSAQAVYENMSNAHGLYKICGIYQTGIKDVYTNFLCPLILEVDHNRSK